MCSDTRSGGAGALTISFCFAGSDDEGFSRGGIRDESVVRDFLTPLLREFVTVEAVRDVRDYLRDMRIKGRGVG